MATADANVLETLRQTQHDIERLYELEPGPDVTEFVCFDEEQRHEAVLVRQSEPDTVELLLLLPRDLLRDPQLQDGEVTDARLQLIEGVSHFVLLTERARTELPATHLELEIQAEVDKFALLAMAASLGAAHVRALHRWLFEGGRFLHPAETEAGQRYRHANDVAARLCARLDWTREGSTSQALLRRFYRSGQAEKLRLALAA
jgi:hypothetical protein